MNKSYALHLAIIVGVMMFGIILMTIGGISALNKMERLVVVVESLNEKVDRAANALAPLGEEAVYQGAEALKGMDSRDLGKGATKGMKELGDAAKKKAINWMLEREKKNLEE